MRIYPSETQTWPYDRRFSPCMCPILQETAASLLIVLPKEAFSSSSPYAGMGKTKALQGRSMPAASCEFLALSFLEISSTIHTHAHNSLSPVGTYQHHVALEGATAVETPTPCFLRWLDFVSPMGDGCR